jgi:hypothetical protein
MKRYKELRKQLNESELQDGGALGGFPADRGSRSAFSDYGLYRVENEEQLKRLKAFINAFTSREYLEPRAALSLLRVKLNLAGLDFQFDAKTDLKTNQPMLFKLKRFGGTFGTSPTHDLSKGFEVTDGFMGDSLSLIVNIIDSETGLYVLDIKVSSNKNTNDANVEPKN